MSDAQNPVIGEPAVKATAVEYAEIDADEALGLPLLGGNLSVVKNVKVRLQVKAGEAVMSIGELMALREGQVVKLDSTLSAPLQVLLEGQVVASGELMAVGDNFAVRIVNAIRRD